jgi:SAM-dependent methyltransferase
MNTELHQLQKKWERRAKKNRSRLRGVLFQGLPESINQLLNRWHKNIISKHFIPALLPKGKILDIGSGYGRLSAYIMKNCPKLSFVGMDFSFTYCQRYRDNLGQSVCAAIEELPFADGTASGAIVVTALMYVREFRCKSIISEIVKCVQPGGVVLFVDPGMEFIHLLRQVFPSSRKRTTGGDGFKQRDYEALFLSPSFTVVSHGSNIIFTLCLPLLLMFSRVPQALELFGSLVIYLDHILRPSSRFALHRWVLVRRDQ